MDEKLHAPNNPHGHYWGHDQLLGGTFFKLL